LQIGLAMLWLAFQVCRMLHRHTHSHAAHEDVRRLGLIRD
jgi:hypothetical protein